MATGAGRSLAVLCAGHSPSQFRRARCTLLLVGFIGGFILGGWRTGFVRRLIAIAFPAILVGLHIVSAFLLRRVTIKGMSRQMDAALGAVLGGAEAVLILSAAIVIVETYFGTSSTLGRTFPPGYLKELARAMNGSTAVDLLRGSNVALVLGVLGPLLPKDLHTIFRGGLPTPLPFPGGS
jgi:hypothetical protein